MIFAYSIPYVVHPTIPSVVAIPVLLTQLSPAPPSQFARELEKLQSDYDDLVRTCQRREQLEYMARQKLTSEVRRATDLNNSLSSQLDTSKLGEDKKQTDRRELLIQQLVTQSKGEGERLVGWMRRSLDFMRGWIP